MPPLILPAGHPVQRTCHLAQELYKEKVCGRIPCRENSKVEDPEAGPCARNTREAIAATGASRIKVGDKVRPWSLTLITV